MSTRFSATILLGKPGAVPAAELERRIREIAGPFVEALEVPEGPDGQTNLINFNGLPVAVLNIDAPAPGFQDYRSDGPNVFWPDVERDVARHRAHAFIMCPTESEGREECVHQAAVVSFVVAAFLDVSNAIGVYWPVGENFVAAETFQASIESYGRGEEPPVIAWIRLYLRKMANGSEVFTKGLAPYAGRELEVSSSSQTIQDLLAHSLSVSTYLIQSGAVFKNGETIGPEDGATTYEIELASSGKHEGDPVYILRTPEIGR